ncbi:M48 family metallopeptidase [Rhodoplanes sp. TEM]|uniref:M48 family metallopeptidase n=1 Tax=Rhodoplanes tepidamans TaxID=200616 RepID=A0ABT5J8Y5_RHOTP|nr:MULTISPECIES: M48 family metallopeptidase [Rhodoplanes]MDC7786072.1 M48 family metallopeptidase [Rhodoplanes tepidamans]MDC7983787.1 M48 family metallopeptidase [Rhodoplanes sp. TEM]MDQ0354915.1 Zn-dependent protease with chaperone function [Rhodoplanes tepidamans]
MSEPRPTGGPAVYWDGETARRRGVDLQLDAATLVILEDGAAVARWPFADLRRRDGGPDATRIGSVSAPDLARIEVADPALAAAIVGKALHFDAAAAGVRRFRTKVVVGSLAVAVSLVLTTLFLVPLVAERLVPFIPATWEERLGGVADKQVKALFGGEVCEAPAGKAALDRLAQQLVGAAAVDQPVRIAVLRTDTKNAVALPGGRIYLLDGLLQAARSPDEIAGVLAHEIGHVTGRDGLKSLIQAGGTSWLLGLLFGDVTGSSAVVFAARLMVDGSHSREAERAADRESARIMTALGRPAAPMAAFLLRVTGENAGKGVSLLLSHPLSEERLQSLKALDRGTSGPPLLDDDQWKALRGICRG